MISATLDTGALIGMERGKPRAAQLQRAARDGHFRLRTITPVVSEWWRGASVRRDAIVRAISIDPFSLRAAKAAGVALGALESERARARLAVDVMVIAFAAVEGGGVVYTSDVDDLERIATLCFPSVRVLGI
ncbi:MAG: PIN domain-containing protein [Deltaproteobacteria bacterium]|nr:PIN domain-containing protein [Deltaproteobacteria bacterium]